MKVNGQYPRIVNLVQFSNKFPHVNIEDFRPALDQPLLEIVYKGKEYFLIFQSAAGGVITIRGHHGMKGKWPLEAARSDRQHPNVHFRLDLTWEETGATPEAFLYFQNERFGQFEILAGTSALERSLDSLAPAFLGPFQITLEDWRSRWSKLRGTTYLRKVLMDQTILCSGIGNYLLAEIMWEARLHPDVIIS